MVQYGMKFCLAADIHLSANDRDYSFAVLSEILKTVSARECGALLFAGDVFDSWGDMETLRSAFRSSLESLPADCAVYYLPGNHEELHAPQGAALEAFDFGRARLLVQKPCQLLELDDKTELLALPFQKDYTAYRSWKIPARKKPLRIVLAHGTVPGITYTGPDEEDQTGVLDTDIFAFFDAGVAALGHLHGGAVVQRDGCLVAYPGSARVWREGEKGPRRILAGDTNSFPFQFESITMEAAGEYRVVPVSVSHQGVRLPENLNLRSPDWLLLEASGFVEDEKSAFQELDLLKAELEKKCRRVTVSKKNINILAGISTQPLALDFIKKLEEAAAATGEDKREIYELARLKGLDELKKILEKRK
jgi:DNA repair exonuclease SbcCD nuclease subunit